MDSPDELKPEFTDAENRTWKLRITFGLAERIKAETGVELGDEKNTAWLSLLFGDRGTLVSVLWMIVEKQAKELGVTPEEFAEGFDGATLCAAGDALACSVADFFPRSRIARAIRTNLSRILAAGEERAIAAMGAVGLASSPSATTSPESSESIPPG